MGFVSTDTAVIAWLKTQTSLLTLFSGDTRRIDAERPKTGSKSLVVYRVGGQPMRYLTSFDRALLQMDCWAGTRTAAQEIRDALVGVLCSMASTPLTEGVLGHDAEISSIVYSPGAPGTGAERYVVTALVTTAPRAAALIP